MFYEVIWDHGETANKCTIAPLTHRADFRIFPVKRALELGPLHADVMLHHRGECLTQLKERLPQVRGIATVDCVWRRLEPLLNRIVGQTPVLARIPDGFVTAYPRRSKLHLDPEAGLATIEAIFIAAALLGNWDETLLSAYHFSGDFLTMNRLRFADFGIDYSDSVSRPQRQRNALQRRKDRGRIHIQSVGLV